MAQKVTFTSVISNKGFRFLWINQILLQLSFNTLNFALIFWVFKLTDSNFALAGLMLAVYLPSLIFGLLAGVLVDIADRKKMILLIDGLFVLAFASFIFIKDSYSLILLATFFINSLSQFFMPTESSSIPLLVNKKQLFIANSLFSLTFYGAFMLGFSIAGPIMNIFGINAIFLMGFILMMIASILAQNLPRIKVNGREKVEDLLFHHFDKITSRIMSETVLTVNFIRGKLNLAVAIGLMAVVQGVVGILAVTISSYMERVLRIHATDASYVLMLPLGLGMMTGVFLIGRIAHTYSKRALVIPAIISTGLLFFLMGITPTLAAILQAADLPVNLPRLRFFFAAPALSLYFALGAFLMGLSTVAIIVPAQTTLQQHSSQKIRGKIFAVLSVMMNLFAAIPVVLVGVLSDLVGVLPIFMGLGVVILLIGVLAKSPAKFFAEHHLPYKWREFLGLGHWSGG